MKIEKNIRVAIINAMPNIPPEIGGILGGRGGIVDSWILDTDGWGNGCCYSPNITKLNEAISEWQIKGIEFMGVFHVHFWGVSTLSDGDKSYITQIMQAMPKEIKQLYFPLVVMPDRRMVPYIAQRGENTIIIKEDELETRVDIVVSSMSSKEG